MVIFKQSVHTGTRAGTKKGLDKVDIGSLLQFIKTNITKEIEIEKAAKLEIEKIIKNPKTDALPTHILPKDPRFTAKITSTNDAPIPIGFSTPLRPNIANQTDQNNSYTNISSCGNNTINVLNVSYEVKVQVHGNGAENVPWKTPIRIGGLKNRRIGPIMAPIPVNELKTCTPPAIKLCDFVPDYAALHNDNAQTER